MFGELALILMRRHDQDSWVGERQSAERLEDLISPSGMPYQVMEDGEVSMMGSYEPKYARTDYDPVAEATGLKCRFFQEFAYYCAEQRVWIQGVPYTEEYDHISVLSGSSGILIKCRQCDREIGRIVEAIS